MSFSARRLRESREDFEAHVWPVLGPLIGDGELIYRQRHDTSLELFLDTIGELDYIVKRSGGPVSAGYGLASRVQRDRPWCTFTIRVSTDLGSTDTESPKLHEHWLRGDMLPKWMVHAYVYDARLQWAAAMLTDEFCRWRWGGVPRLLPIRRNPEGARFEYVLAADLIADGLAVRTVGTLRGMCAACGRRQLLYTERGDRHECLGCWRDARQGVAA